MDAHTTLLLAYIGFTWLLVLHTFEEIANGVFGLKVGPLHLEKNRYLLAASALSTLNLLTLALLAAKLPAGTYLGLLMAAVPGVLQGIVHTIGYFKQGRKTRGLGVGFYSALPLSLWGAVLLGMLIQGWPG